MPGTNGSSAKGSGGVRWQLPVIKFTAWLPVGTETA